MKTPDDWTIRSILRDYATKCFQNEIHYTTNDIDFTEYHDIEEKNTKLAIQAMKLIFTKENYAHCSLIPIESFVDFVISEYFIPYDGTGYYIAFDGTKIGPINWDNPRAYPEETVFVAWYNK